MRTLLSRLFITPPTQRAVDLPPHASLQLHVTTGTQLVCVAGGVLVQMPATWLAETLLTPSQLLDEGCDFLLSQTSHITLRAGRSGARLQLLKPASRLFLLVEASLAAARTMRALGLKLRSYKTRRAPVHTQTQ